MIDTLKIREESTNPTKTEEVETKIETEVEAETKIEAELEVKPEAKIEAEENDEAVDTDTLKSNQDETCSPTKKRRNIFNFWKRKKKEEPKGKQEPVPSEVASEEDLPKESPKEPPTPATRTESGVILCSDEASMTRQLNAFSNIVRRVLLFGGDQELLIVSETLAGNDRSFVDCWYPNTGPPTEKMEDEVRPGVQYLNALISLLREAYEEGIVTKLEPLTSLSQSYSNSYERLVASLVEDGSGYIRAEGDVMAMPKPRTATEELGRFAVWESAFRSKDEATSFPDDIEGTWEVKDEVGGETIGVSTVNLLPNVSLGSLELFFKLRDKISCFLTIVFLRGSGRSKCYRTSTRLEMASGPRTNASRYVHIPSFIGRWNCATVSWVHRQRSSIGSSIFRKANTDSRICHVPNAIPRRP